MEEVKRTIGEYFKKIYHEDKISNRDLISSQMAINLIITKYKEAPFTENRLDMLNEIMQPATIIAWANPKNDVEEKVQKEMHQRCLYMVNVLNGNVYPLPITMTGLAWTKAMDDNTKLLTECKTEEEYNANIDRYAKIYRSLLLWGWMHKNEVKFDFTNLVDDESMISESEIRRIINWEYIDSLRVK